MGKRRLLIISNMAHYVLDGEIVGHGPTAREISYLSTLFESVRHIACLYPGEAPALMLPYQSDRIELVPVPPAGGVSLSEKLTILRFVPQYVKTIHRELAQADVVHVRCPANIPLLAIIQLAFRRMPQQRWIKYAGNWQPNGREARSYTFQRWWLRKNFCKAEVSVNGRWEDSPAHVHAFPNPCLTEEEIATGKQSSQKKALQEPVCLLYVGRIERAKGVDRVLSIAKSLREAGIRFNLTLIGDGAERPSFESQSEQWRLADQIRFIGWLPRTALELYYKQSHLILFPSSSEGWPKVLSEAMAYGVVPIASNVGSIPQNLRQFNTGRALSPDDIGGFVDAVQYYVKNPDVWKQESDKAVENAHFFSYKYYLEQVKSLLELNEYGNVYGVFE